MDRFQTLLWDLGEEIQVPLHVDENHACRIVLENGIEAQLEMHLSEDELSVVAFIAELPPGCFRIDVLKEAMKENGEVRKFGRFGYIEKHNMLVLSQSLKEDQLSGPSLANLLEVLIEEATDWNQAISSGRNRPDGNRGRGRSSTPILPPLV